MFDHVTLRASEQAASVAFYTPLLGTLGIHQTSSEDWITEWDEFSLSPAGDEQPPTRGLHLAFSAPSRAHVDAFWEVGRAAGHPDAGAPGVRPQYREDYYGAFLRDPDGNSAEAVHHGGMRPDGHLDHLWLRVADLEQAASYVHLAFPAGDDALVHAFHRTALAAGHRDNGVPGERAVYQPGYCGAFMLDPDGNNVEVVNHHQPA